MNSASIFARRNVASVAALAALLVASAGVVQADTKTHAAAANELLDVVNTKHSLQRAIDQLVTIQLQQQPKLQPFKTVFDNFFNKYMSFDALKSDIANLYVQEFSEKELRETIAFYKTPTGAKIISKLPDLMRQGSEIGLRRVQQHLPELQAEIKAKMGEQGPQPSEAPAAKAPAAE